MLFEALEKLLRSTVFIILSAIVFFIPIIPLGIISENLSRFFTKLWFKFIFLCFGIKLEVQGNEKIDSENEKFIIVANHRSFLDIPALYLSTRKKLAFLAKQELLKMPVIGWGIWIQKHPLAYSKLTKKSLLDIKRAIEKCDGIVIFPEGTRGPKGSPLLPLFDFKKGVEFITRFASKIYPVALWGTHKCMPRGTIVPRKGKIKVVFADPIKVADTDKKMLKEKLREKIESMLYKIEQEMEEKSRI